MPETDNPQPPSVVEEQKVQQQPTQLDEDEYHLRADEYMEAIHERAEQVQENREDVEVEYSVCYVGHISLIVRWLTFGVGWRSLYNPSPRRHVHYQQATSKQTDLAFIADFWTETVRLGAGWRRSS